MQANHAVFCFADNKPGSQTHSAELMDDDACVGHIRHADDPGRPANILTSQAEQKQNVEYKMTLSCIVSDYPMFIMQYSETPKDIQHLDTIMKNSIEMI